MGWFLLLWKNFGAQAIAPVYKHDDLLVLTSDRLRVQPRPTLPLLQNGPLKVTTDLEEV